MRDKKGMFSRRTAQNGIKQVCKDLLMGSSSEELTVRPGDVYVLILKSVDELLQCDNPNENY